MDAFALLRLQVEWGADEALADEPVDRLRPAPRPGPVAVPRPAAPAPAATPAARGTPAERALALAFHRLNRPDEDSYLEVVVKPSLIVRSSARPPG